MNQTEMDKKLFNSIWIEKCKNIDTDVLEYDDVMLVQKCIHQQPITDEELKELRILLKTYTDIDEEYNISTAQENIEEFEAIINDEQAFLDLVNEQKDHILKMKYHQNGKIYILEFSVKPISDSRALSDILDHAKIFENLTDEEKELYTKANSGKLTPREQKMIERLNTKIQNMLLTNDNLIFSIENFLVRQVELRNSTLKTDEERKAFWEKLDISYKLSIFEKAREILHLNDMPTDSLFL